MKKILSIFSAGLLALLAFSCVTEEYATFDESMATAPVLGSYELGEKALNATYTPGTFDMGFNQNMPVNHSLILASVNGRTVNKALNASFRDGEITLSITNLAKSLIALGYQEGETVSLDMFIRASLQAPNQDNGRNGHVDSQGHIMIDGFEVFVPVVQGNPWEAFTEKSEWSLIGSIASTGNGWNKDEVAYKEPDGKRHVVKNIKLTPDDQFKFRKDGGWDINRGAPGEDEPYRMNAGDEVEATQNGKNLGVNVEGSYDILYDEDAETITISEAFQTYPGFDQKSNWSVIGSIASVSGMDWNKDISMITDGEWHVCEGVVLTTADQFKFRMDQGWDTNLGAPGDTEPFVVSLDEEQSAAANGKNLSVPADGTYDLLCNPTAGLYKVVVSLGGHSPLVGDEGGEDEPDEPVAVTGWNIIGLNGDWDNDILATEKDGVWTAYITAAEPTEFKWRKDGDWAENYGGTLVNLGEPFEAVAGGGNIQVPAGFFKVVLNTNDLTITVSEGDVWSLIGDFNSWGGDVDMVLTDGKWVSPETAITAGGFKIRHNHDWAENFGGTLSALGEPFEAVAGGDNISIEADGTYVVTYDPSAGTITVVNAKKTWGLIGVNDDWSNDVAMTEVMPGIWVSDEVTVEKGGWKVRFDKGWDVNRGGATPSKQGEFVKAVPGGDNIGLLGTFKVVYNANNETIGTLQWGLVGSIASIPGFNWNADVPMNLGADGKWYSIPVALTTTDEFKIRENAGWDNNRGGECVEANAEFAVTVGGSNIKAPADGTYMVIYDPANETITLSNLFWGIIGGFNDWGGDVFMMYDGAGKWVAYNQNISGEWKLRQGCGWDVNRGGTYTSGAAFAAEAGGSNITVSDKETFSIIYDSAAETITVE